MAERVLNALIDEHIALLAEARQARDHWKQHAADLSKWLSDAQDDNAELVAALEGLRINCSLDKEAMEIVLNAIAKARDNG